MRQETEFMIKEEAEELRCLAGDSKTPASEIFVIIQKNHREKKELQGKIIQLEETANTVLAQVATEVFDLNRSFLKLKERTTSDKLDEDFQGLDILRKRIQDILNRNKVEAVDLTGRMIDDEMLPQIVIIKNIPDEHVTQPVVRQTIQPLILRDGKMIQKGVVTVVIPKNEEGG